MGATRGSVGRPRGRPRLHNLGSRGPRAANAAAAATHNGVATKKFPCSDDDEESEDEDDGEDGAEDAGRMEAATGEAVEAANQGCGSVMDTAESILRLLSCFLGNGKRPEPAQQQWKYAGSPRANPEYFSGQMPDFHPHTHLLKLAANVSPCSY